MQNQTAAVIVAAGASARMGGIPKLFVPLAGKEAVVHTLIAFENAQSVSRVYVVCRAADMRRLDSLREKYCLDKICALISGGATRQQSVQNGVEQLDKAITHVAIHDGARPLITPELIDQTVENAYRYGASAPGVPVKDTIKVVAGAFIQETPDRNSLVAIQTPQVFAKELYMQALLTAQKSGRDYTDDCKLMEALGARVFVTPGTYENLKLTTPEDIAIAESLLFKRNKEKEGEKHADRARV